MEQNFGGVALSMKVGNYLKRNLGRNKTVSRAKFAEDFDIDDKTVQRWVNNGVNKLDTVDEIAYYFGVSVVDILSDEDDDVHFYCNKKRDFEKRTFSVLSKSLFLCYHLFALENVP